MTFETFKFDPSIMAGIQEIGYVEPTPIQSQAIPVVLQGRDIIGLAQTGTGKTAAFVLPILQRLVNSPRGRVGALIISPTRELAEQTHDAVGELGRLTGLRSVTIYGGVGMDPQLRKLRSGAEIVVGCPGRILDHLWRGTLDLTHIQILVIDEADRLFDMGFLPDVRGILECILHKRQTLLFSATMPDDINRLVKEVLHDPVTVQIGQTKPAKTVSHALYPVEQKQKSALLEKLLRTTAAGSVLVFTRTKHRAERVSQELKRLGFRVASMQGNLSQPQRQRALDGFKAGTFDILVATDIAARGIDVDDISYVINYDMPDTTDAYIHRIGRTGRIGKTGDAFTFVTGEDADMVRGIERILGVPIERRRVADFNYSAPAPELAPAGRPSQPRRSGPRRMDRRPAGPGAPRAANRNFARAPYPAAARSSAAR